MLSSDNPDSGDPDNARHTRPVAGERIPEGALLIRQRAVAANWKEVRQFLGLLSVRLARSPYSVCVLSDRGIRRYNKRFRGRDEPADVLSFPAGQSRHGEPEYLGDILISAEKAQDSAKRHGLRLEDEIKALALHGLLHLLGYDHESNRGEMARREKLWGGRLGLPQTLLGRARRARGRGPAPIARKREGVCKS